MTEVMLFMLIKSQLIAEISKQLSHLPEKDIMLSINNIIEQMSQALDKKERIEIRGFGSFSLHFRPPRNAHNPKTGQKLVTIPKFAVHFKSGKELRQLINDNRHLPIEEVSEFDNEDEEA